MVRNASDTAYDTREGFMETVRQNPIPAALVGLGLGWLWMNRRGAPPRRMYGRYDREVYRSGSSDQGASYPGRYDSLDYSAGRPDGGGNRATQMAGRAQHAVGNMADQVGETAGHLVGGVQYQAQRTEERFGRALHEDPLAVGAVALALGAAVGLVLPQTERENQLMGEARDTLVERAQEFAQDTMDKVQHVAAEAQQTAQQEARSQGLTS